MRDPFGTYSVERWVRLADNRRYRNPDDPEHEDYIGLVDRIGETNFDAGRWQPPETYRLAGPPGLSASVGAGGSNIGDDVAQIEEALLSLDGLGLSGWLARTGKPGPRLNASIAAFQGLNGLEPDGLINPGGPTLATISRKLPPPERDMTARGIGDTLAERRAEAAFEAERRAEDPFGDIFGGKGEDPVLAAHVDKWLAEDAADVRAQRERDAAIGSPNAPVEHMNYAIEDTGADGFEPQLLSMNNSQREQIIDITMGHEGGLSKDKKTNFGIQQNTLNDYNAMNPDAGFKEDVALLEKEQAAQIYREMFYDRYGIGDIDDFSIASHFFDLVVLHEPGRAAQIVQEAINRMVEEIASLTGEKVGMLPGNKLRYDRNNIGEETRALLDKIIATQTMDIFHNNLVDERIAFMRRIAENNSEDRDYLDGWIDRAESFRQ